MPQFEEVIASQGFDANSAPRWQMVPLGEYRIVKLTDSSGLTVSTTNSGIVTVMDLSSVASSVSSLFARFLPASSPPSGTKYLILYGAARGSAFVEAKRGGTLVVRLEVGVKQKKNLRVAFNFLRDSAGHRTSRVGASVTTWIDEMNRIFTPQANVVIKQHSLREVRVGRNLGRVVQWTKDIAGANPAQHEWPEVVALRDGTADFNMFYVWAYEQDATPLVDDANAGTLDGNCLLEDDVGGRDSETMAHETGHHLGCLDYYGDGDKHRLMYGYKAGRSDTRIPKNDVNTMNP